MPSCWCPLTGVPITGVPSLVSPHWCPLTGIPHWCLPWWPRDRPPDAHSQVHTLIPELTPEAGLRPRAPKLLIQVLGTPGVTMAQPQACQEASHLKTHCPLTGSCALAAGRSMGVHGLSCWISHGQLLLELRGWLRTLAPVNLLTPQ